MVHLSRISLRNFKSFRRASLPISQGMTCIVGPNGSGKSNIVDAICFVLGRSSAKSMRAERFSDLIFNGGKKEKPAKEAEVSLYLDNSAREIPLDSREVKITRRVEVGGNSTYMVNNKRTTKSEILDLLRMINVNPDGHNIVLQGDVTRVVEMNPVERRKVIDDIAGIAEYDQRKEKAARELEKVEDNLSRARDVFREISSHLRKLEKEKKDAQRYEELAREIKRNRALVTQSKYLEARAKLEEQEEEIGAYSSQAEKLSRHIEILSQKSKTREEQVEKVNQEIVVKEESEHYDIFKKVEELRGDYNLSKHKAEELKEKLRAKEERVKAIGEEKEKLKEEKLNNEREIERLEGEKAGLDTKISSLKKEIEEDYGELAQADENTRDRRLKLGEISKKLEERNSAYTELHRKLALLEDRVDSRGNAREELEEAVGQRKGKLEKEMQALEELEDSYSRAREEASNLQKQRQVLGEKIKELKEEQNRINPQLEYYLQEKARLEAEYQAMERIKKGRGSFNKAVSEVLRLRDEGMEGIHGTIAELGQVEKRYSRALEVAAGGGMLNVVVENDGVAQRCIQHLKKHKVGRATFLPLNKLKTLGKEKGAREVARRGVGFALDLVRYDSRFRPAFQQVFRSTVVVEDLEFARKYMGRARMVTLDGDLAEKGGRMTGGHYMPSRSASFGTIDEEKAKIESIAKKVEQLRGEKEKVEGSLAKNRERFEDLKGEERRLESEVELSHEKIGVKKEELEGLKESLSRKEAELRELREEISSLEEKVRELEPRKRELGKEVEGLKKEKNSLEEELSSSGIDDYLEQIKSKESKLHRMEKEKESTSSRVEVLEAKKREIVQHRLTELERERESLEREMDSLREESEAREEELLEKESRLKEEEGKEKAIKEEISRLRGRRDFLASGREKITRKIESLREEKERAQGKVEKLKVEKAREEVNLENLSSALEEFSNMEMELIAPIETSEIEKETARMEAEKKSLEPINMRAIEDYEEVKEKYDRFEVRIEQLEREYGAIEGLMEEIEGRKMAVFMEVFENVAMNFRTIFGRLSGGRGELLLDEEAPLEGGLRIQARPPGKNPQYIELLSGGERTLTALSFIIAIQRYQPAPFYIFDEVDMFLDDQNVSKISDLIKESSREEQFLVVSLRDSMIVNSDQLFGVSSQQGISKILGVELEDVRA